ncbi:MAG TPA: hypothetical protein VF721_07435 [Pyrinomonadaceae bacterium]|jgi:hypothetical protein
MRLIKVSAPEGRGEDVARTAFSVGIDKVSIHQTKSVHSDGRIETKDAVDVETSTPKGKRFVDAVLAADFYNPSDFSINTRQPRSIISKDDLRELTLPLVEPSVDILEELWQFTHVTYGFVGRIFIAACLLAYGLIQHQILLIIAGLLFLPLLPLMLSIGFGAWTRNWKLVMQGFLACVAAAILLLAGGAAVAAVSNPPLKYNEFNSLFVGFLISVAVAVAAGLANIDDVGRREMIGLAATAQIAIIPVWFGICLVFGFPATTGENEITQRALAFFINVVTIIVVSLAVYVLTDAANRHLARLKDK